MLDYTMALKPKVRHTKTNDFRSIFKQKDFLRESDSSIEKAVFWSSNFLPVPTSGRSLLNIKFSQEKFMKEKLSKLKIVVNVGGERFVLAYKTVSVYPETLLATEEVDKYFDRKKKEYFFDRDPDMFRYIFKFYTQDQFHFPMEECMQALMDEFKFFRIPLDSIKECCYAEFHFEYENNLNASKIARQNRGSRVSRVSTVSRGASVVTHLSQPSFCQKICRRFALVESRTVTRITLLCVILNILAMVLETLPCPRTKCVDAYSIEFFTFDSICVVILSAEFLVISARSPNKKQFLRRAPNVAYLLSLVPAYATWVLYIIIGFRKTPVRLDDIFKALRVFRLVKIANSSTHIRETVGQIVSAARGLGMVLATCTIAILVLSVLLYHLDDSCPHVPLGMWYFVVTMTSLGYGDYVPSATLGKLLGAIGVFLGILAVSLPVPIIQNKIGATLDEDPDPETEEIVLDNLYPPDYKYRQRRFSRMVSLEHKVLNLKTNAVHS